MADLDGGLVAAIDRQPRTPHSCIAFRHLGPGHSVTGGEGARIRGGRWNPPESFPVLYMGLSVEAVRAEFYRFAERQGMPAENLLPRRVQEYLVELQGLLYLRDPETRSALGLTDAALNGDDATLCQAIGDAAHYAGFEGLIAPSATGTGEVLAVFTDKLGPGSSVTPSSSEMWDTPT